MNFPIISPLFNIFLALGSVNEFGKTAVLCLSRQICICCCYTKCRFVGSDPYFWYLLKDNANHERISPLMAAFKLDLSYKLSEIGKAYFISRV